MIGGEVDTFIYKLGGLLLALLLAVIIGFGIGYWWLVPDLKNELSTLKANQLQHDQDTKIIYDAKVKENEKNYNDARNQWITVVKRLRDQATRTVPISNPTSPHAASGVYGSIPELGLDSSGQLVYAGKPLKERLFWCARDAALVDAFQNWALRSGIPIK